MEFYIFSKSNILPPIVTNREELLFLNPDGVRTRFPIGWGGGGRYVKDSLRIVNNTTGKELKANEFGEEENRVFFEFKDPPATGSYTNYTVRYVIDPTDYAFSMGTSNSAYPGEEYFLFPNWNNAKGCGHAFWVGKYAASRADATTTSQGSSNTPVSKKGKPSWVKTTWADQVASCLTKGSGFHCIRNREWVSIALWTQKMGLNVKGNGFGYTNNGTNIDGSGTNITSSTVDLSANPSDKPSAYAKIRTGMGPNTFRHNGRIDGISDMVGNVWECVDGLQLRDGVPYILNDDNTAYVVLTSTDIVKPAEKPFAITNINNKTEDILNEGLPISSTGTIVSGNNWYLKPTNDAYTGTKICYRGGHCYTDGGTGVWTLGLYIDSSARGWDAGFRLARAL